MRVVKLWAAFVLLAAGNLAGESGQRAWLRYSRLDDAEVRTYRKDLPAVVVPIGQGLLIRSAQGELLRGVRGMLGRTLRVELKVPSEGAIVLGTFDELRRAAPLPGMTITCGAI